MLAPKMLLTAFLIVIGALLLAVCGADACAVCGHASCGELECSRPIQRLARKLGCACSSRFGLAPLFETSIPSGIGPFSATTPCKATLSQVCALRI